jgi:hypothetical protein
VSQTTPPALNRQALDPLLDPLTLVRLLDPLGQLTMDRLTLDQLLDRLDPLTLDRYRPVSVRLSLHWIARSPRGRPKPCGSWASRPTPATRPPSTP